jgi:uncharacterized membrane protein
VNPQAWLLRNALLAAIYAALTLGLAPFSYGPVQVRVSECLTLLAFCNRKWIPGLTAGCFLANLGSPFGLPDMVLGTLATFLGIWPMHRLKSPLLASLCPVISNGVVIGAELDVLAALPPDLSLGAAMIYIGAGEFLSVTVLGTLLLKMILKNETCRKILME